ncbi:MAG: 1-deoxy-D-xylulose-5-phosphate synthase [Bacteroidetes bacterium]|nr:MAG: 1-deoxy-D-xylulose-5-phosphate synthase [Bacteroidota bacterium]PIE87949.1 MAG: 1-deoxy-D-xylulose-5-phosphate synthase [Bacteroidota bacterium]
MTPPQETLLHSIQSPEELRKLSPEQLPQLCRELREFIIDVISENPGHLGANLGVIELTVALHYVFNTPYDQLVWDVGHQAYAHKILTGRRERFHTNRAYKGLSGFPKRAESEYDTFGTGHSSTAISAALGMATASKLSGERDKQHIAVVGDASIVNGLSLEGLNNAGVSGTNILIILNDNDIAIDQSVGAIKEYFTNIRTSKAYNKLRDGIWRLMGGNRRYGEGSRRIIRQIKNAFRNSIFDRGNLFEAFKIRYFGSVDGHDITNLIKLLNDLKSIPGPKILHTHTVKGKGFHAAERNQTIFHAPGMFDKKTGQQKNNVAKRVPPKYQDVFGKTLVELAEKNEKIIGITPAMPTGCSMNIMMKRFPQRSFDVGIAEEHAVTFSAGLATQGYIPFCNIYSTFMQRAYDEVIHDVALQNLPVIFCMDRGGLVGEDGPTHHGIFDLTYFRAIPNMIVTAPMDEIELRNLMFTAQQKNHGPFSIRYPRGRGVNTNWERPFMEIPIGKGRKLTEGKDIAILSLGHPGNFAATAVQRLKEQQIHISHYDVRFLKPLDTELLHQALKEHHHIITIEDGTLIGGLGSAVQEFVNDHQYPTQVVKLGIPDQFIEQGSPEELYAQCGINQETIYQTVITLLKEGS